MTLSHHLLLLLVVFFVRHCSADSANPLGVFCNKDTKIGSGKAPADIIDLLLVVLVSKASTNSFVAIAYDYRHYMVHGLTQCRGDVEKQDCSTCIQDAAKQIRTRCPNEADARIWFDYCFLRYSNKNFIREVDTGFGILYRNAGNVTEPERFNEALGKLMEKLRSQAVDPQNAGLGKGQTKLTPFITLYALVQCTRDLSPFSCAQCLAIAVSNFPDFCDNRKGCRVLYSSCYTRYELYPFFFPLTSAQNSSNTQMVMVYP